jgi:hypothetical protein
VEREEEPERSEPTLLGKDISRRLSGGLSLACREAACIVYLYRTGNSIAQYRREVEEEIPC